MRFSKPKYLKQKEIEITYNLCVFIRFIYVTREKINK